MVILLGLASWRIANMLVNEAGPGDIFEKLRSRAGIKPGPIEGFLPGLFSCIYCMSVWTTLLVYLLWSIEPAVVIILAAAAIAVLIQKFVQPEG